MKSSSQNSFSCFGTFLLALIAVLLIRYTLPGAWGPIVFLTKGALLTVLVFFVAGVSLLSYFIIRNLKSNKKESIEKQYQPITRTKALYHTVLNKLQKEITLNDVPPEELLQAEVLISDKLKEIKTDLIRLHEFTSVSNQKILDSQIRQYKDKLKSSADESVTKVSRENLNMLEDKKKRIADAFEEIRQKEALVDLAFNSLQKVEEDLKFGRPVRRLFSADVYHHFGLTAPIDQERL
ncbi:MAG: hypothetical protein C5B54_00970, partial [Acidobacteria bacterium]